MLRRRGGEQPLPLADLDVVPDRAAGDLVPLERHPLVPLVQVLVHEEAVHPGQVQGWVAVVSAGAARMPRAFSRS